MEAIFWTTLHWFHNKMMFQPFANMDLPTARAIQRAVSFSFVHATK